ncbi:recombinase family protein [Agromyces bauzanensis]
MAVIGYARVSTGDQNTEAQEAALRAAGCSRVFTDQASGSKADRPQLTAALDHLNAGDTLVVWRLDRLGRSLPHLVEVVRSLGDRHVEFRSLTEAIDTTTPAGRLLFHVAAAFAEFERDLIQERTRAGLAAAREAGRVGGRPTVMTPDKFAAARALIAADKTHAEAATAVGVSLSSLRRALRAAPSTQTDSVPGAAGASTDVKESSRR